MITAQEYKALLTETIANLDYSDYGHPIPAERVFSVNLNTRQITVPTPYPILGVAGDHRAETVWFVVNRFFDGVDLSPSHTSKRWGVQVVNANRESMLFPIEYFSLGGGAFVDANKNESGILAGISDDDLILGWPITYDVTKLAGNINFSLRCYILNDNQELEYSLGTEPAVGTISTSLNITEESENVIPPKDTLSELVYKITEVINGDGTIGNVDYNNIVENTLPTINGTIIKGKLDSATDLKINYSSLPDKPSIKVDGVDYVIGGETPIEVTKVTVDGVLDKDSINPVQNKIIWAEIDAIKTELGEMSFIPMSINSFIANKYIFENGYQTKNDDLIFTWDLSKAPVSLKINETDIPVNEDGSYTWSEPIKNSTVFTLTAADNKSEDTEDINIIFTNRIYYTAMEIPETYNGDFISSFSSELNPSKKMTFNVTAAENQYIYYAVPVEYGIPVFAVGGFDGGFEEIASNIQVKNAYGITLEYNLYRSTNHSLGNTTVVVS
jgi:hypothetical protein